MNYSIQGVPKVAHDLAVITWGPLPTWLCKPKFLVCWQNLQCTAGIESERADCLDDAGFRKVEN